MHGVGALVYVDGVHLAAHAPVDVAALGADIFACSPYKFLGPHCGVLAGGPELLERLPRTSCCPQPSRPRAVRTRHAALRAAGRDDGGGRLARLPRAAATGDRRERLMAAMTLVEEHEDRLRSAFEDGLAELPGVTVPPAPRSARRRCC